jgi:predicted house-cleaning noncanonical NTP pyrophosphatase (MazG superfamily)
MAHYEKLVRDRIPEILDAKGVPYEKRIADDAQYRAELIKKLLEEAQEFTEAGSVEELADVLEVVDALRRLPEYADVEHAQAAKRDERGGFLGRIIVSGDDGK